MISRRGGCIYRSAKFKHENTWYVLEVLTKSSTSPPSSKAAAVSVFAFSLGARNCEQKVRDNITRTVLPPLMEEHTQMAQKKHHLDVCPFLCFWMRTHVRLNSPLTSHRESSWEEGGDDVARQGSEHVEGPVSGPEDTRYSHFCFHSRYVGSLGLRKEPNTSNQYDLVSLFFFFNKSKLY